MTIKRTILYYPHIEVPDDWLKKSLLYWDEIGSIIPHRYRGSSISASMDILRREEIFRRFDPTDLMHGSGFERVEDFASEFRSIIKSTDFIELVKPLHRTRGKLGQEFVSERFLRSNFVPIHHDKISHSLVEHLDRKGLVYLSSNRNAPPFVQAMLRDFIDDPYPEDWILMERRTAGLYMSLLAKYLADNDMNSTVTGTNDSEYHQLNYGAIGKEARFACYTTTLHNILPSPERNTSIDQILKFRQRRKDELFLFRSVIQSFQDELSKAADQAQIMNIAASFSEKIIREVNNIQKTLRESSIESQFGSLQTFVKMGVPTLLTGMAGPILSEMGIVQIPVELSVAAASTVGLINIGTYIVGQRNQRSAYLRNAPFSYLYYGRSSSVLDF